MVRVDPADDQQNTTPPTVAVTDAHVVVHSSQSGSNFQTPTSMSPTDLSAGATACITPTELDHLVPVMDTTPTDSMSFLEDWAAEGGTVTPAEDTFFETKFPPHFERHTNRHHTQKSDAQARTTPTNPMSVSVPNLTSNMEQTVSLLESFAAVARRNLGNNSMNNMGRPNNASNLVRLALASNANGRHCNLNILYFCFSGFTKFVL